MRVSLYIAFLVLLSILVACTPKGDGEPVETRLIASPTDVASPALSAIDSLLWRQPDSALAVLMCHWDCRDVSRNVSETTNDTLFRDVSGNIMGDVSGNVSTYDRHYAHLLLAELLYKNDYDQTNRAELLEAVGYFDSLCCRDAARHVSTRPTTTFLDARAHYINGVGYYEHDSVVEACKEYLTALEVMEEHFEEEELLNNRASFMALTYTRLTDLFSDLYLHEQAIYFGKRSLHYYNKYEASPVHIVWMLNKIGSHYDILNNYDSACYFYNQGLQFLSDTNNSLYRGIASHMAFIEYEMGISPTTSLIRLHALLAQAENDQEYASRCLTIGEIYYHEHQLDSAYYYLDIVYEQIQSAGAKKQAAEWLAEIAESQGRNSEGLEYASFLVPFANVEENQSGIKTQLTELYNESKQTHLNYQQHKETQKRIRLGLSVIGVLFLVIIFLFFRSIKQKKNLETERLAHKIQQAALAGRLRRSNAILKEQEKKQASASASPSFQHQISTDNYLDEPICKHILAVCNDKSKPIKSTLPVSAYANIALSDNQKAQLKDATMRHYGHLFETLKQKYPELKEKDFLYCYLSLLGLDNVQIAVLQQNTISTIWERENRLKKILGSKDKVSVTLQGFMNNY